MTNEIIEKYGYILSMIKNVEKKSKNKKRHAQFTEKDNQKIDQCIQEAIYIGKQMRKKQEGWSEYFTLIHKLEFDDFYQDEDYLIHFPSLKKRLTQTKELRDFLIQLNIYVNKIKKLKTENNVINSLPSKEVNVPVSFPLLQYQYSGLFIKTYQTKEDSVQSLGEKVLKWGKMAKDHRKRIDQKLYYLEEAILELNLNDQKQIIRKMKEIHHWRRERRIIKEELQMVFELLESLIHSDDEPSELTDTIHKKWIGVVQKRENQFILKWMTEKKEHKQTFVQLVNSFEKKRGKDVQSKKQWVS